MVGEAVRLFSHFFFDQIGALRLVCLTAAICYAKSAVKKLTKRNADLRSRRTGGRFLKKAT